LHIAASARTEGIDTVLSAIGAQLLHPLVENAIIRYAKAALTACQKFALLRAEDADLAERTYLTGSQGCAVCLRGILEECNTASPGQIEIGGYIAD
jgi:hypothetical protein